MAATRTLVAHTTGVAGIDVTILTNGTTVATGTLDTNVSLLPGDMLEVVVHDTATGSGHKATIIPKNTGCTTTIEGTTSGSYVSTSTDFLAADADNDETIPTVVKECSVWTSLVGTATDGANHAGVQITSGYAGAANTRRTFVYVVRADTGKTIPVRFARVIGSGHTHDTTTGAGHTDSISIATPPSGVDILLVCTGYPDNGTSGINVDADNNGVFELTTPDTGQQGGIVHISKVYDAAGTITPRPGSTVAVKYIAAPGANGHITTVTVYLLESVVNVHPTAAAGTGTAYNASVLVAPYAGNAAASGVANDAVVLDPTHPRPTTAVGVGTAYNPTIAIKTNAGSAVGVGTAYRARRLIPTPTETDVVVDPTIWKIFETEINFGDPTSFEAVISAHATVWKDDPADAGDIRLVVKRGGTILETGPWVALTTTPTNITFNLSTHYEGTGFSLLVQARTTGSINALVTGAAPTVTWIAGVAPGVGTAYQPAISVKPRAGAATAAGVANNPGPAIATPAGSAAGTGTAYNASIRISPQPATATAVGTANNPTLAIVGSTNVFPDAAVGVGTAYNASVRITVPAGNAAAVGTAANATTTISFGTFVAAGVASAAGTAYNATIKIGIYPSSARGVGIAYSTRSAPISATVTVDGQWSADVAVARRWTADVEVT